jgi:hypothetical protein
MANIHWQTAHTTRQLHAAQQLRWRCLVGPHGGPPPGGPGQQLDVSVTDTLPNATLLLVYDGSELVGTARLTLACPDVARAQSTEYGFELERWLDLRALGTAPAETAEISRLVSLPGHSGATLKLLEALYVTSRQRGIRFWVGGVDLQTSEAAEALVMYCAVKLRGGSSARGPVTPRPPSSGSGVTRDFGASRFYAPGENTAPETARVAPAIDAFARRLGAKSIGLPVRNLEFGRMVLPMIVEVDRLPPHTLTRFEPALRKTPTMRGFPVTLMEVALESQRRLDEHPIGGQLIAGTLTHAQYAAYLRLVVDQTRCSPPLLERAGHRLQLQGRHRLAALFLDKAREEAGHDRWALEDLEALGMRSHPAVASVRSSAVHAYAAWLEYLADSMPTAIVGLAHVLEWLSFTRASQAAENLVKVGAIPRIASAVRFLREHGRADEEHINGFSGPLEDITCPNEAEAITRAARVTTDLYLGLLESAGAAVALVPGRG